MLGVTAEYLLSHPAGPRWLMRSTRLFIGKYRRMDPTTKDKIRRMVDLWDDGKSNGRLVSNEVGQRSYALAQHRVGRRPVSGKRHRSRPRIFNETVSG